MELRIGPPATGDNFYPRKPVIDRLLRTLKQSHVAFLGPRRTGKSSCLLEIEANPGPFIPILLDLEKHETVEAWLKEMLRALREALDQPEPKLAWIREKGAGVLSRIDKIKLPGDLGFELNQADRVPAWRRPADEFLKVLCDSDVPVLFLLDEFPTFLKLIAQKKSQEEVEAVLNWFRAARQALVDRPARFLVTGSIGLKGVVKQLGLSPSINDFDVQDITPMTDGEASGFLAKLVKDVPLRLDSTGCRHILNLIGVNWPFLIQLFASEIQDGMFLESPTNQELDLIYQTRLVAGSRNQYCDGMYERLKDIFTLSECQLAREILKDTCYSENGLGREDFENTHSRVVIDERHRTLLANELDNVLDTLKHDGYLFQQTTGIQRTVFASNMLRDFWRRKVA